MSINFYGLIFIAAIMVPNIVFAATHKNGFTNYYQNKTVEVFEQIGRTGCFVFVFFNINVLVKAKLSCGCLIAYLVSGGVLTLTYILGWIILWKENSLKKSLLLSVVPALLFFVCGSISLNIPLIVFAVIFAPCHIFISYKNAKAEAEKEKTVILKGTNYE